MTIKAKIKTLVIYVHIYLAIHFFSETRKWKQLETKSEGPRPDLRMGHTATYDPTVRCIYVYGGSKNLKWFNDVHALDVDEKMWQLVKVIILISRISFLKKIEKKTIQFEIKNTFFI